MDESAQSVAASEPLAPPPGQPIQIDYYNSKNDAFRLASFVHRAAAFLIDALALGIFGVLLGVIGLAFDPFSSRILEPVLNFGPAGVILALWLYFAILESSTVQGTLGKHLMGVKVVTIDGDRLTFARATARFFSKFISAHLLGLGFLFAAFTARRQAVHDLIVDTLVIFK